MHKTSIRNRLIILLLIATIVPFGSSIVITYFHTKESLKDQVVQENSNLLYQGKVNVESYINELNGLILSLYNNPDFMNFMRSPNQDNNYLTIGIVKQVVQTILYAEDNIERVRITFAKDDRVILASKLSTVIFSKNKVNTNQAYFRKADESPFNLYIEPGFTLHRSFRNVPSEEVLAYFSLEVAPDRIFELSQNLYRKGSEEFYIITSEGDTIYSSNNNGNSTQTNHQWMEWLISAESSKGTREWKDDSFSGVMIYDQIPQSAGGWFLVKRIPYATLYESVFKVTQINIMFGVIGLGFVILATLFVSFRITSPIRILLQHIQQVEEGDMKVQFESLGNDEIGVLGDRFKQMIEKINHLINREYKLELENKNNQLKVLQSQINPHFLYNALQSIGTLALKNNVPQIYTLITHLSKIMRYGMDMEESMVPLIKEINYAKAFLLLQKERFGDQLEYSIYVDEEVNHVPIPKMILQPIVENYFKHGFDTREGVGRLKLVCKKEGAHLIIEVSDNGVGISKERLGEIKQILEEGNQSRKQEETNIGLKNVYVRLKLYYGSHAKLILRNQSKGGLLVNIKIPIVWEGEHLESNNR